MDYLTIILAILLIDLLALISPGPNFILVTSSAVSRSRRHALFTGFGIATGSLIWASAAALGIASVFEALPALGFVLKLVGVAYLLYLGISLLRSKGFRLVQDRELAAVRASSGFRRGLLVNMTNPKSATYYASVFAAFLTPDMPVWVLVVLVAAIAGMSLVWHAVLAVGFSTDRVRAGYIAASTLIDRLCGAVLIALGLRLLWDSR